jgi:imidazoleglycerol-phosphate dehydratase/histidinol-phosphatase
LVMVTNQDGLGTESFPENTFWPVHNLLLKSLEQEGIFFEEILIDRSLPKDGAPTRKPKIGMLTQYFDDSQYDLANSYVIGDRLTDIELAKNLNAKGIFITNNKSLGANEASGGLNETIVLKTKSWEVIYDFLKLEQRITLHKRATHETDINLSLNLDGSGKSNISTGIVFFDHMLDQLARHGGMDISLQVKGDLEVDEHHTIEDTAIVLGEAFAAALGNKLGIERYGFCLPMDDCLAQVAIDFGGRNWLVWEAEFTLF